MTFSPLRIVLALMAGAATGAALVSLFYIGGSMMAGAATPSDAPPLARYATYASSMFAVSFIAILVGLIVIAGPFWFALHRLDRRSLWDAIALGAALTFVTLFLMQSWPYLVPQSNIAEPIGHADGVVYANHAITAYGWRTFAANAAWPAPIGAAIGAVIWWVAYGLDRPRSARSL